MVREMSGLLFSFVWVFILTDVTGAIKCQPGQMATLDRKRCTACPDNQHRPQPGDFVECLNCRQCVVENYSTLVTSCTPTKDAECKCLEGFTPLIRTQTQCRCEKGSGIYQENGKPVCRNCPHGMFTSKSDSKCQAWKKCDDNRVMTPGSHVSDVVCQNTSNSGKTTVITQPLPAAVVSQASTSNAPTMAKTATQTSKSTVSLSQLTTADVSRSVKEYSLCNVLLPASAAILGMK
ncbi:hypothetical protein NFI96_011553, partial [Prochilodus magdalenae]